MNNDVIENCTVSQVIVCMKVMTNYQSAVTSNIVLLRPLTCQVSLYRDKAAALFVKKLICTYFFIILIQTVTGSSGSDDIKIDSIFRIKVFLSNLQSMIDLVP